MKNEHELGSRLLLPVWITAAAALAGSLTLYLAPQLSTYGAVVIAAVGIIAIVAQFIARRLALGEIGSDVGNIARQMAEGRFDDSDTVASPGSLLATMIETRRSVRKTIDGFARDTSEVSAASARLSGQTTEMAMALQLQANTNREIESAIHEIDRNIDVVSGLAAETRTDSKQVAELSMSGEKLVVRASDKMTRIVDSVSRSSTQIGLLMDGTRKIGSIANIIKEIADQTNLLALNAAIEAARAGEQGRGFAVVADEVRKLAERTSGATAEISKMIASIQTDTKAAVEQMAAVSPELESGVGEARDAADMLRKIKEQAHDTLVKMSSLADATAKGSNQSKEIVAGVANMISAAEKAEQIIRDTSATSASLETNAANLEKQLRFFRHLDSRDSVGARSHAKVSPLLSWNDALSTGIVDIDNHHKRLIELANQLNEATQRGEGRNTIGSVLNQLVEYTVFHFDFEEQMMKKLKYSDFARHQEEHKKLVKDVLAQKAKFDQGAALSSELLSFIRDWLVNHIMKADKALGRALSAK